MEGQHVDVGINLQPRSELLSGRRTRFLENLRSTLGDDNVIDDARELDRWSRTTLPAGTTPLAVVRPADTSEVQAIMVEATRQSVPLHPISRGRNWGYGDACAVSHGQVIVDLGRMNHIIEVDEELGIATIEPGVTQKQMEIYLEERGIPFLVDATGAGPDVSIVGNTLERGFGHTPGGDRFLNSCGMEVVLPDGRLLKTGFSHYANSRVDGCYKWGIGPYLDGLFTQSNLGIVTRLTFWLVPKPECFKAFFLFLEDKEGIGPLVEVFRALKMRGTIKTAVHFFNDVRLIAGSQPFPWDLVPEGGALSDDVIASLRRRHGIGAWTGTGGIYGSTIEVAAAAREIKKAFKKVPGRKRILFVDDRRMRVLRWMADGLAALDLAPGLRSKIEKMEQGFHLLRGCSSHLNFRSGMWRVRRPPSQSASEGYDPLAQRAGFLWLSPILPMRSADVARFQRIVQPIFREYGFDFELTLSMVTARALCAVTTISYNKDDAGETERATGCHEVLLQTVINAGYIPYRAGNLSMGMLDATSETFWDVKAQIKRSLDPSMICSPGHYEPEVARSSTLEIGV